MPRELTLNNYVYVSSSKSVPETFMRQNERQTWMYFMSCADGEAEICHWHRKQNSRRIRV